ncbi:MAG: hypothetical protein JRI95_06345 [Deltaproteobacteria bacterium]|nr:hypothetical protein [Deltaproteobacteria bacterium]
MKWYLLPAIVLTTTLAGCGGSHHYRVGTNSLYLYLNKSDAVIVYFASSLDGFKLHLAEKKAGSTWAVTLPANRAFTYFYMIDGVHFIPSCRLKQFDDFGSKNCVYVPEL